MHTLTRTRPTFTLSTPLEATLDNYCTSTHQLPTLETKGHVRTDTDSDIEVLTLYTSEPQPKIDALVAAFSNKYPDIEVDVVRGCTGELESRIASEAAATGIGADVLLLADAATFERLKWDEQLLEYLPAEVCAVYPEVVDPQGYYVGTRIIPTVIAHNTTFSKNGKAESRPPTSWKELTDSKFHGQIAMPCPRTSGAAAYNAAVWKGTSWLGQTWLDALAANQPMVAQSNGWVGEIVAAGIQPVGIVADYVARELAAKGLPISLEYPTEGAPYVTQPVGIVASTHHQKAAKKFVDFLVSKEAQELAVEQYYLPVRRDVTPPNGFPPVTAIDLLMPNLARITATKEGAADTFADLIKH